MKREFRNRLVLKGQLPDNAHLDIPLDTPVEVISTHITTPRGLRAALRKHNLISDDYSRYHGNMAAFRLWFEYNGKRLSTRVLNNMIDFIDMVKTVEWGADGFENEYRKGVQIAREVDAELDKEYNGKNRG